MPEQKTKIGFDGLEVVSFESRMATEMAAIIQKFGGVPLVAPSMREVPLEENRDAFKFGEELFAGRLDAVILMTGVGTRTLVSVLETRYSKEQIVAALSKTTLIVRGPKSLKVLRDLGVPPTIIIPEPNTWREILDELDENPRGFTLPGSRVAVQEYGIPNEMFLRELEQRGVKILRVPVYRWALPEDTQPLRNAMTAIVEGRARVVLFTNARQIENLIHVATECGLKDRLLEALAASAVCSVGPRCSEVLIENGVTADLEPAQARMGPLVQEASKRAAEILKEKSEVRSQKPEAGSRNRRHFPVLLAHGSHAMPGDTIITGPCAPNLKSCGAPSKHSPPASRRASTWTPGPWSSAPSPAFPALAGWERTPA